MFLGLVFDPPLFGPIHWLLLPLPPFAACRDCSILAQRHGFSDFQSPGTTHRRKSTPKRISRRIAPATTSAAPGQEHSFPLLAFE